MGTPIAIPASRLPRLGARGRFALVAVVVVGVAYVGADPFRGAVVNSRGGYALETFFGAALSPDLEGSFLDYAFESALTTVALSVVAMTIATLVGLAAGLLISTIWRRSQPEGHPTPVRNALRRAVRFVVRSVATMVRSIHELLWALLLLQAMSLPIFTAIIALALPSSGMLAKLFADIFDDLDPAPIRALRIAGAPTGHAVAYAVLPRAAPQLVSYGLYRTECVVLSSVILGFAGVPGIGLALANSFHDAHYHKVWTLLFTLVLLVAVLEILSTLLRRALKVR